MDKRRLVLLLIFVLAGSFLEPRPAFVKAAQSRPRPLPATASDLVAAVNALRASNGLPAYSPNSILMGVAQAHAEYMAATDTVTHYSANGSRPFQRALAAGYPVSGSFANGQPGFFSENIIEGWNMTVDEAITAWLGDYPHTQTMLAVAGKYTEIGGGVATSGSKNYFVIDVSKPAGSMPVYTPSAADDAAAAAGDLDTYNYADYVNPVVVNTPETDGRLWHVVQPGEALWAIAIAYHVKVAEIQQLNGFGETTDVYPNQKLLIATRATAIPPATATVDPNATATVAVSQTPAATATIPATPTQTEMATATVTPVPQAAAKSGNSTGLVIAIIFVALIAAGGLTWLSGRKVE
jgi:uncharacterized protein YkwD